MDRQDSRKPAAHIPGEKGNARLDKSFDLAFYRRNQRRAFRVGVNVFNEQGWIVNDELKQKTDLSWLKLALPAAAVVLGILILILFFAIKGHGLFFVAGVVMVVLGCIFTFRAWNRRGEGEARVIITGETAPKTIVNSLNLHPDKVFFTDMAKPAGQPWKCRNDGKSYYVNKWEWNNDGKTTGEYKPFNLPDQQYMDPVVFAQRVLELPAHRRIFTRKQTILQQLSPMMAAGGAIIVWILILTTG